MISIGGLLCGKTGDALVRWGFEFPKRKAAWKGQVSFIRRATLRGSGSRRGKGRRLFIGEKIKLLRFPQCTIFLALFFEGQNLHTQFSLIKKELRREQLLGRARQGKAMVSRDEEP